MLTMYYLFNLRNQNPNYYLVPLLLKRKLAYRSEENCPQILLLENI